MNAQTNIVTDTPEAKAVIAAIDALPVSPWNTPIPDEWVTFDLGAESSDFYRLENDSECLSALIDIHDILTPLLSMDAPEIRAGYYEVCKQIKEAMWCAYGNYHYNLEHAWTENETYAHWMLFIHELVTDMFVLTDWLEHRLEVNRKSWNALCKKFSAAGTGAAQ